MPEWIPQSGPLPASSLPSSFGRSTATGAGAVVNSAMLEGLRESLVDERRAEHGTAELDINVALELCRLSSLALEVGRCGAVDVGLRYVEVQVDRGLWTALRESDR